MNSVRGYAALALIPMFVIVNLEQVCADPLIEGDPLTVSIPVATEMVNPFGASVTRLDRDQIDRTGALDIQTALRRATGVSVSRFNAIGAFGGAEGGSIYIRGRGTGRPGGEIRVYTDGVPREVGVWGHPLLDTLPLRHMESITVHKSPQPIAYGGVFGALDSVSPQRQRPGFETVLDTAAGEFGAWLLALRHGGRLDAFDYYGGISQLETDGHRERSGGIQRARYARVGYNPAESIQVAYILHQTDNWSDDPGAQGSPVPRRERFANATLTQSLQMRNTTEFLHGYVILYHEDGKIRWARDRLGGPGSPAGDSNTDWENTGVRILQDARMGIITLTGGLDLSREGGASVSRTLTGMVPLAFRERYRIVSPTAALRADLEIEQLTVTPSVGLRHYRHSRFDSATAPQAGLVVRHNTWRVFANAARGIHYPGVYVEGVSAGTLDDLKAETLNHAETGIGARCPWSGADVQISLFRDRSHNQLHRTPAGFVNQNSTTIDGLELTLGYTTPFGASLFSCVSLMDASGDRTPRAPGVSATTGFTLPVMGQFVLQFDVEHRGAQYAFNSRDPEGDVASLEKLGRHTTVNTRFVRNLRMVNGCHGEISLGVENLTNETYAYWPGYPMPRRHVIAGLKLAF